MSEPSSTTGDARAERNTAQGENEAPQVYMGPRMNLATRIRNRRLTVYSAVQQRVSAAEGISFYSKLVIAVGSLTAAVCQLLGDAAALTSYHWITIIATLLIFVAAVAAIVVDSGSAKVVEEARKMSDDALDLISQNETSERRHASAIAECVQARHLVRALTEAAVACKNVRLAGSSDPSEPLTLMLRSTAMQWRVAMGLRSEDDYSICIYRAVPTKDARGWELELIAHERPHASKVSGAYRWQEGEGVAGTCFRRNEEIPVTDLTESETARMYAPHKRPEGTARMEFGASSPYVSLFAVPIGVQIEQHRPWGVVVASSAQAGHFTRFRATSRQDWLRRNVLARQAVKSLADVVACAVAICREPTTEAIGADGSEERATNP